MQSYSTSALSSKYSNYTDYTTPMFNSGNTYKSETVINIENYKGHLMSQFIEITINITTGATPVVNLPFGLKIAKTFNLNSQSGVIQLITSELMEARLAEFIGTPTYDNIIRGLVSSLDSSTTKDYIVKIPLLWYFVEKGDVFMNGMLPKNKYNVTIINNDNLAAMGLGSGVTSVNSISYRIRNNYLKLPVAQMNNEITVRNGYNCYVQTEQIEYNQPQPFIGSLTCGYKTFENHFILKGNDGTTDYQITKIEINGPNGYLRVIEPETNYVLRGIGQDPTTSVSVPFGSRFENYETENYISYDPDRYPYTYKIYYSSSNPISILGAKLTILSEYHTKVNMEDGTVSMTE